MLHGHLGDHAGAEAREHRQLAGERVGEVGGEGLAGAAGPQDRRIELARELEDDLFLAVPVHRAPSVVVDSGMTEDGWIPVDPLTLQARVPGVYAVGDVTSVGTPKAGVFAEGQASVVASAIIATVHNAEPDAVYDGHGICYMEFGGQQIAKIDVTFQSGSRPVGWSAWG